MLKINKHINRLSIGRISQKGFLSGTNSRYQEQMFLAWKKDPQSVHVSWRSYFENLEKGMGDKSFSMAPTDTSVNIHHSFPIGQNSSSEGVKISQLIRIYQKSGFIKASLDPLKMNTDFDIFKTLEDFNLEKIGFSKEDMEKEFELPSSNMMSGFLGPGKKDKIKLKDLVKKLEKAYCENIGIEFKHMSNREEVNFIIDYMENKWVNFTPKKEDLLETYISLAWATKFEKFLEVKFMTKRFGLEGLESMITGLHTYFEEASKLGVKDITLGMAHRGRLNVLANIFGKSMKRIFKEMMGKQRDTEGVIVTGKQIGRAHV